MVQALPLPSGEWYKSNHDKPNQAPPIAYDNSREQSTDIRRPTTYLLRVWGNRPHVRVVPFTAWSKKRNNQHDRHNMSPNHG